MRRIAGDVLSKLLRRIDEFTELEGDKVREGITRGREICKLADMIKLLVKEEEKRENYREILFKLDEGLSRISMDLSISKEGKLGSDWRLIALKNHKKLKKHVLKLREFLKSHEKVLRGRLYRESFGLDFRELVEELKKSDYADPVLVNRISDRIRDMDANERLERMENNSDRLKRISRWLYLLKEVENAVG